MSQTAAPPPVTVPSEDTPATAVPTYAPGELAALAARHGLKVSGAR
ncbi:ABC transporter permease, partial [Streptomyces sp. SID7982]|nr:ABC transporter permease [Streptomyces sp. SID7982]